MRLTLRSLFVVLTFAACSPEPSTPSTVIIVAAPAAMPKTGTLAALPPPPMFPGISVGPGRPWTFRVAGSEGLCCARESECRGDGVCLERCATRDAASYRDSCESHCNVTRCFEECAAIARDQATACIQGMPR